MMDREVSPPSFRIPFTISNARTLASSGVRALAISSSLNGKLGVLLQGFYRALYRGFVVLRHY